MFPIRDHNPSGRTPYVTYLLMAVNIGVFLSYVSLMSDARAINMFFFDWALIPGRNVSTTLRQWLLDFRLGFLPFALVG